jgi:hypothetical protein
MTRVLAGIISIKGTDDETWPFKDEKVSTSRAIQGVYLDPNQPAVTLNVTSVKWGGECRVEIEVGARVVNDDQIQIEGNVQLFEGITENTQDLEDQKQVIFLVPRTTKKKPNPAHHTVQLVSKGFGGGDHAEISFSFTNRIAEE